MRTWTIELRTDFDTATAAEKEEIMREAAKVAAKHIFTTATLLSDKRKPQIALSSGDFFSSEEEINLADDIPEDYVPAAIPAEAQEFTPPDKRFFKVTNTEDGDADPMYFEGESLEEAKKDFVRGGFGAIPEEMLTWEEVEAIPPDQPLSVGFIPIPEGEDDGPAFA